MSKIEKIAHLADIHIRKSPRRENEYRFVFNSLYESLKIEKPDRIVIVGDIVNEYLDLQSEQIVLVCEFFNELAKIAPLIITRGNHDMLKKSPNRKDPIEGVVKIINNSNVTYLNETKLFDDENVVWCVWKHGDKKSPWKRGITKENDKTYIDLYHDPIHGSKTNSGYEFNSSNLNKLDMFRGDYLMAGDIHKQQYFRNKTAAYSGSLIEQDFSEGNGEFHGYLLWNIKESTVEEIPVKNEYSYNDIIVTSFTDFDDLDIEIENETKYKKIRVIWRTLPSTRSNENERKLKEYLYKTYENIVLYTSKNEFLEEDVIDIVTSNELNNIMLMDVQHKIFTEYFEKIGIDKKIIDGVLKLDEEISGRISPDEFTEVEWNIVRTWGENLFSYEKFDIDWSKLNGLTQIIGENRGGKTTLVFKNLAYVLYGKTPETEDTEKNGDSRYVNNKNNAKYCLGGVIIEANGIYYGIERKTTLEYNKQGELKGSPTSVNYYLLESGSVNGISDDNLISKLNEDKRKKTEKEINKVIGSFDNYMRTVLTTSDTINTILSNKQAEFIDTLLFDSGLDIFDVKLKEYKEYLKEKNTTPRIVCDVTLTKEKIKKLKEHNNSLNLNNVNILSEKIPALKKRIDNGEKYVRDESLKLFRIDDDILTLNVENVTNLISELNVEKNGIIARENKIKEKIDELPEKYDSERLDLLLEKKEQHKIEENEKKMLIKNNERDIIIEKHEIEKINGDNININNRINSIKNEIENLKKSRYCPTCGELKTEETQNHIKTVISEKDDEINKLSKLINENNLNILNKHQPIINKIINNNKTLNDQITQNALSLENELIEIGELNIQKNYVETRGNYSKELEGIPVLVENIDLKIQHYNNQINRYKDSKLQIVQNEKTNQIINKGNKLLESLRSELIILNENVSNNRNSINNNIIEISKYDELIINYKKQLVDDEINDLYKKIIHRNGIPKQILSNIIIPKINIIMSDLLSDMTFSVLLDPTSLKLKLISNEGKNSVINAISGSGKERTFSSIVLKFALNQINLKSKPNVIMLDEMMGKLTGDSVDEFIILINKMKEKINKLIIIEHNHELNPDNIISVLRNDNGISEYELL